ncbi:MAG: hypothetical protein ACOYIH_11115 [Candidatus Fimadaptatus sp.]
MKWLVHGTLHEVRVTVKGSGSIDLDAAESEVKGAVGMGENIICCETYHCAVG